MTVLLARLSLQALSTVSVIFVWFLSILFLDSADPRYLDEKEEKWETLTVSVCYNDSK